MNIQKIEWLTMIVTLFCMFGAWIIPIKFDINFMPEIFNGIIAATGLILGFILTMITLAISNQILTFQQSEFRIKLLVLIAIFPITTIWAAYIDLFQTYYYKSIREAMMGLSVVLGLLFYTFYLIFMKSRKIE